MMALNEAQLSTVAIIRTTAESLWDIAESCWQMGECRADDWEEARLAASHLLAAIEHPPAPTPLSALQPKNTIAGGS